MRKSGYDNDFAAAVMVSASTIGPIIPPSITAVVYAVLAEISVGALLLAGLVPGILLGLAQMVIVYVIARRKNYPRGPRVPWGQAVRAFIGAVPALLTPVIILGGIAGGVFTPTEAGAVACAYAVVLGFVTRRLTFRQLWRGVVETGRVTATIMIILATASVLSWVIAVERVPQAVAAGLLGVTASPVVILLLVNLALVVVGCFMDTAAAMILLVPVLAPLAVKIGVDPVHLGIIVVLNLVIGMATPPVGYALFIGCSIARASIDEISRRIWPFLLVSFAVLLLVTFVPAVSLWFPRLFVPF
jgi:C4-dicarboxylate transporter DctM subunit